MPVPEEGSFRKIPGSLQYLYWALAICGLIIALAYPYMKTVYLHYRQFSFAQGEKRTNGQNLILNGRFLPNTLNHEPRQGTIRFTIETADGEKVKVVYYGSNISDLENGTKLAVEGSYSIERVFIAKRIWTSRPKASLPNR